VAVRRVGSHSVSSCTPPPTASSPARRRCAAPRRAQLGLDYAIPHLTAKSTVSLTSQPKVDLAVTTGHGDIVVGGETSFDTAKNNVTRWSVGAGAAPAPPRPPAREAECALAAVVRTSGTGVRRQRLPCEHSGGCNASAAGDRHRCALCWTQVRQRRSEAAHMRAMTCAALEARRGQEVECKRRCGRREAGSAVV